MRQRCLVPALTAAGKDSYTVQSYAGTEEFHPDPESWETQEGQGEI